MKVVMKMEAYWPQNKVFLLGVLSLFPQFLENEYVAMSWKISKYLFDNKDEELFEDELRRYQDDGYLKFEIEYDAPLTISSRGSVTTAPIAYFISAVDSQKAKDDLTKYLERWRKDEPSARGATKPADFSHQQVVFLAALTLAYANNKKPIIKWSDLYGEVFDYHDKYLPPFWELILFYHFIDGGVEVLNMGYEKVFSKAGHKSYTQPFTEYAITDPELLNLLKVESKQLSTGKHKAKVGMNQNVPYVELDSVRRALVEKKLRTDKDPYIFMNQLVSHTNRPLTRKNGLTELESKTVFTELAGQCGFTDKMRVEFFNTLTKSTANLKDEHEISQEMSDYIVDNYEVIKS